MNEPQSSRIPKDDPRLTAYLLGELEGDDRAEVERALAEDPSLREEAEALRRTMEGIGEALQGEDGASEVPASQPAGLADDGARRRRSRRTRRRRFPGLYFLVGGLAAAGFAVLVAFHRTEEHQAKASTTRQALQLRPAPEAALAMDDTNPAAAGTIADRGAGPVAFAGAPAEDGEGFVAVARGETAAIALTSSSEGYERVRRLVYDGRLPSPADVRIGEMLNAFSYDKGTQSGEPLAMTLETARAPWAPERVLVRVQVDARPTTPAERPATTLMIMANIAQAKGHQAVLDRIRAGIRDLARRLRPTDRVGIVAWTGEARVELEPTSLSRWDIVQHAIDQLGSTDGRRVDDALVTTLELAHGDAAGQGGTWRVVVCSDGGVMPETDESRALDLLEDTTTLKALALADWGPKPSADDFMERLAEEGRSRTALLASETDEARILARLVGEPMRVAASAATLRLHFNPGAVKAYRILGYEAGGGAPDSLSGGEMLEGQSATTLVEIEPVPGADARGEATLLKAGLSYVDPDSARQTVRDEVAPRPVAFERASADFRFSASVAAYGLALKSPTSRAVAVLDDIERWARSGFGSTPAGDRVEFTTLLERSRRLLR